MSKFNLPPGVMCKRHPNYRALRAPKVKGGCSVCDFIWMTFGKRDKVEDPKKGGGNFESQGVPQVRRLSDEEVVSNTDKGDI